MNRVFKQLIYSLLYLTIIGLIVFGLYNVFKVEPTCFDGILNQGEEDVDCGQVCGTICLSSLEPINVTSNNLVAVSGMDYDFLAKVTNPNTTHGSGDVDYQADFKNSAGMVIDSRRGSFDILPGQTRFILISPVRLQQQAVSAELKIVNVEWQQLTDFSPGDIRLVDRRKEFIKLEDQTGYARVDGVLFNNSDFDFDLVEVVVLLYGSQNQVIATGSTRIRTFLSRTENFFQVNWFTPFEGEVSRIEVQATTNAFDNLNFLRRFGGGERFQQF